MELLMVRLNLKSCVNGKVVNKQVTQKIKNRMKYDLPTAGYVGFLPMIFFISLFTDLSLF